MAKVRRLPSPDDRPAPARRDKPADVFDLQHRRLFEMAGLKETARDLEVLPNPRDVGAAIEAVCRDFRRILKQRHGVTGEPAMGAVEAVRIALRAEINRIRTRKEVGDGRHRT